MHVAMPLSPKNMPLSLAISLLSSLPLFFQLKCPHEGRLLRTTDPALKASYSNAALTRAMYQKHYVKSRLRLPSYPPTASLQRAGSRRGKIQLLLPFDVINNLMPVLLFFSFYLILIPSFT